MSVPITLDETWRQMIADVGGVEPSDSTLISLMLAFGASLGSGGQIGPGYVNVFDFLTNGVGTAEELNAAIATIGGPTGAGGVIDLSGGTSKITYDEPIFVPSNTLLRTAGPQNTKFVQSATYQGDCLVGGVWNGNPNTNDQYITLEGGGTITGSAPQTGFIAQRLVYVGSLANITFVANTPKTIDVFGDVSPVNYAGAPTGWLPGGGTFYAGGTFYLYTGVAGSSGSGAPTAGTATIPNPHNTILGVQPFISGNTTTLHKNNYLLPYTAGANAIGTGIRMSGFRIKVTGPSLWVITNTWSDAYGLWNNLSQTGSCWLDNLTSGSGGGYIYANYGVADSFFRDLNSNGMGLGGIWEYGADQIGESCHLTNGPTSSAFTVGFTSGGEKNQRIFNYTSDGMLGGAIYIENGRHSGNPTEVFKAVGVADIIGQNFNVTAGFDPMLCMDATGNNTVISDIDIVASVSSQYRVAQGSSAPCSALAGTLTAPSSADMYFVSMLSWIINPDAQVLSGASIQLPNLIINDSTGTPRSFNALTAANCAMAVAKTITDGGSNNGVGVQGTTGVVTLYAAPDQYNFFNPFITGKNVVLPDPNTTAPIFLNNITVSGNGKVLTGTWGPSTVLSGHTNIGTAAAQNATVTQCYVSGVTSTHTFTGTTNITGASAAASCSVNATGHGLTVGNVVNIVGVLGTMGAAINGTWPVLTVPDANHFTIGVNTTGLTATASTGSVGACTYGVIQAYGASTPGALYSAFPLAPWTIGTQVNYVPQKTDVHWTAWRGNTNPTPQFNVQPPLTTQVVFSAGGSFTPASTTGMSVGANVVDQTIPGNLAVGTQIGSIVGGVVTLIPPPLGASASSPGDTLAIYGDQWTYDAIGATPGTNATALQGVAISATAPTVNEPLVYNGTAWAPGNTVNEINEAAPTVTPIIKIGRVSGTYSTGGTDVTFGTPFPTAFICAVVTPETTGGATQVQVLTPSTSGFVVALFDHTGTELASGTSYIFDYVAYGN